MNRPSSVVLGRDKDVIPLLLSTHAVEDPRILDVTYNRGVMWKGRVAQLPTGQISNHYEDKYWTLFSNVPAVALPPAYDGHTPAQAALRLRRYLLEF